MMQNYLISIDTCYLRTGNTKPDIFVRLERAVHKSEGFVFPRTDRVTRPVNVSLYDFIIFPKALSKNNHTFDNRLFPAMVKQVGDIVLSRPTF